MSGVRFLTRIYVLSGVSRTTRVRRCFRSQEKALPLSSETREFGRTKKVANGLVSSSGRARAPRRPARRGCPPTTSRGSARRAACPSPRRARAGPQRRRRRLPPRRASSGPDPANGEPGDVARRARRSRRFARASRRAAPSRRVASRRGTGAPAAGPSETRLSTRRRRAQRGSSKPEASAVSRERSRSSRRRRRRRRRRRGAAAARCPP